MQFPMWRAIYEMDPMNNSNNICPVYFNNILVSFANFKMNFYDWRRT